jgi:hypothetical protein
VATCLLVNSWPQLIVIEYDQSHNLQREISLKVCHQQRGWWFAICHPLGTPLISDIALVNSVMHPEVLL